MNLSTTTNSASVIWDNCGTLHRGTTFEDLKYKRDMRCTIIDEYATSWAAVG